MNMLDATGVSLVGAPPHELVLAQGQVPVRSPEAVRPPAASPGTGPSSAVVPGASHSHFDPTSLAGAMMKFAAELLPQGAPASPTAGEGILGGPTNAALLPSSAPQLPGPQSGPTTLETPGNTGALNFGAGLDALGNVFRIPLFESDLETDSASSRASESLLNERLLLPASLSAHQVDSTAPIHDVGSRGIFDPNAVRSEFPILEERVNGKRLVWLDNAATTQKPRAVIDRLKCFYEHENSNIHRAAHTLAARATDAYEAARESTRRFLNAASVEEIVFVRGATEGINLVAQTYGRRNVGPGDEIVITWLEHHANIVPWQMLCSEKGAKLRVAPVDDRGQIILEEYERLLNPRTKIVALPQVSNALGTVTPAAEMVALAHRHGARVLVDGAQSVSHRHTDVQALDADFFVFSGHKVFAPTGIGAVFGKKELLDAMPPWQGGGNMIADVTFERTRFQPAPARLEAGTGSIGDAAGLGAALDWLMRLGLPSVERYEHELLVYGTEQLAAVPGLTIIGTAPEKAGVISFVLDGQRTESVGAALDKEGIAVRSGHHCAQPILRRFGLESTVRASFAPYNLREDIDALVVAVRRMQAGRSSEVRGSEGRVV